MKAWFWIGMASTLALSGCLSQVDREAMSFPYMPGMPVYQRADNQQLPPEQAIDALQTAENACATKNADGSAASPPVGSPPFDACMAQQGYRRVR